MKRLEATDRKLSLVKKDDYVRYFVYTPVPSVNYCDGLGRCFRFVCIYAYGAVFLCATGFSVNKDLYRKYRLYRDSGVRGWQNVR